MVIMLSLIHSCVSTFRQSCSNPWAPVESTFSTFFLSLGVGVGFILFVYSSSKEKKILVRRSIEAAGNSSLPLQDYIEYSLALLLGSDSLDTSYHRSSFVQERILSSTEHIEIKNENIQTESFCEICLENKESWQMFRNNSCTHSFCYECTIKHIEARIQENPKIIRCPGENCRATLSFDVCRSMIPDDVLSRWELFLCMPSVPDSSDSPDTSYHRSAFVQERILSSTEHFEIENENIQTESFCEICLENKESWQMFRNNSCTHSFCYECTSKHIEVRIQENPKTIRCPGENCRATLSVDACRSMIPDDVLARWELFLCMSSVPESQKLFCPFSECSAMLINDTGEIIREIECPACHRLFCVQCRVPWHPDFTCKEFQKVNSKKGKKYELMFKLLVKKKNWKKCPSCKMHVEKTEGCVHITCRCGYEFCYRCGSRWSGSHACKRA